MRIWTRGAILIALTLGLAAPAAAQVGISASWQSDYRYRGRSLSAAKPALALNLAYDHVTGAYAGASVVSADTPRGGFKMVSHAYYAGYVTRLSSGYALDAGVTRTDYEVGRAVRRSLHANEAYVGLLTEHLNARIHYSPNYFEPGFRTLYASLDGSFRPTPEWRVFGHAGILKPLSARMLPTNRGSRRDFSAGVARRFPRSEVSLTWTRLDPAPVNRPEDRDAAVLGATVFF